MGRAQPVRHVRLELVRGISVAVGNQHLVADMQRGPTSVRQLEATVLTEPADPREHEVTRPGSYRAADQGPDGREIHPTGGEGTLGLGQAVRLEVLDPNTTRQCGHAISLASWQK